MRDFFYRLARFSFHLALVVAVICAVVRIFLYNSFHEAVAHSQGASTVILGDSHTEWGLVADSIGGAFNFSSGSERYIYNYKKLQALSEIYPVRVVILSLSYHSFTSEGSQKHPDYYYKYCFTLYPFIREVERQECWEMFDRSTMREVMLCHEIGFPSRSTVALIKQILQGYPFLNTTPPVKYPSPPVGWEDRIQRHFYKNDMPGLKEPDYSFVTTIRDMRSFCREKGYSLVLFNAPVSPMYYTHIPSAYKQLTDSVIHTLVDNQTTFYLDYSRHPLPDSCYYDSDHTNFYGANLITPLVCDSLRKMGVLPMP